VSLKLTILPDQTSVNDDVAFPAIVLVVQFVPERVNIRMVSLSVSATYRFPFPSIVMPVGCANCAPLPVPSMEPDCPGDPAMVVVVHAVPENEISRMVSLAVSATKILSEPSTVIPLGTRNSAAAPAPSADPPTPGVPAIVATFQLVPDGVSSRMVKL